MKSKHLQSSGKWLCWNGCCYCKTINKKNGSNKLIGALKRVCCSNWLPFNIWWPMGVSMSLVLRVLWAWKALIGPLVTSKVNITDKQINTPQKEHRWTKSKTANNCYRFSLTPMALWTKKSQELNSGTKSGRPCVRFSLHLKNHV